MISARYAPAISVMIGLALVPTIIHSYAGVVASDALRAERIASAIGDYQAFEGARDAGWGAREFASDDWIDRVYASGGREFKLTVVRSYDMKRLYHHPELAIAYGVSLSQHQVRRFAASPDIPVHSLRGEDGAVALYVLHHGGSFVEDPIVFQLRTAGALLFTPRRQMTLFFLRAVRPVPVSEPDVPRLADLLFTAIRSLLGSNPQ